MGLQRKAKGNGVLCFQVTSFDEDHVFFPCPIKGTQRVSLGCHSTPSALRPSLWRWGPKAGLGAANSCQQLRMVICGRGYKPCCSSYSDLKTGWCILLGKCLVWLKTLAFSTTEYFKLLKWYVVTEMCYKSNQIIWNPHPMLGVFKTQWFILFFFLNE